MKFLMTAALVAKFETTTTPQQMLYLSVLHFSSFQFLQILELF